MRSGPRRRRAWGEDAPTWKRAALGAALLLWGLPALAQGLGAEIADLLRARDCAMSREAVAEVFTVMRRAPEEVEEAMDGLVASGEASQAGGLLTLAPESCGAGAPVEAVEPVPWIEERLAGAPECRMPLRDLAREAEGAGIEAEDFERTLAVLAELGRLAAEDATVRARDDLCGAGAGRDWQFDRILALRRDSFRTVLGTLALGRGCRLPLEDREALMGELMEEAAVRLVLGRDLSPDAQAALRWRMEEALDDPGPTFRAETGALVARYCLP